MKMTLEFNLPEDRDAAIRVQFADTAWRAIDEALEAIRSHQKHGLLTEEMLINRLHGELTDARRMLWE